MDKFIVSARKYRPQTFDTVVGQSHITTTLKNAISHNQLAHAFLFCGPRGVGKTTCARILAKTINCENIQPNGEACDTCVSCRTFNEGTSLNIHELDAASNNSVDDIRSLIEQVRFAPQMGKYKVYIIDEVHMLSSSAFNAFLKTLEEPPSYAIFILATTEKHKILPTILSRCQIFDFKRITINDTVEHLQEIVGKEEINAEKPALQVIAQKSEGCMRDALSIMDKIVSFTNGELTYQNTLEHLNILDADYFFKLLEAMQQQDLATSMLLFDDINRKGFEGDMVLNAMAEFFRNLLVCKDEKVVNLLEVVESFKEKYTSAAKKTSASYIISALNVLNEAEINYKQARNKRLHVELALIKLTYLQQALDLTDKKKVVEKTKAVQFRALKPIEVKEHVPTEGTRNKVQETSGAKLIVEEPLEKLQDTRHKTQEPKANVQNPIAQTAVPKTASAGIKGGLSKLREKIAAENNNPNNQQKEIDPEGLKIAWQEYILKLKAATKHSVVSTFEMMECRMKTPLDFEVQVYGNIQLGFLKQEKTALLQHVQSFFKNPNINILVQLVEEPEDLTPVERPLSMKEQFIRMTEKYPLVKDLKDRLGLELDY
ncbi:DNA polymerase III subunit gamma/tau [Lacibacter sediminis]|uniref:DNA polymerase III subunit gamma/tau n=1 Tax=Lacibacter sediminis TaxID=2760713 RepID=A0A7G5XE71_9BACT|nr:DNA polymerase III subunit gamma/tau [Lacibacter sediminis]QNA43774.1 DNA polymerase III subunit gamma/tau [Lacibacter sediminis]